VNFRFQAWRTLLRRELGAYFVSWTGYVVIAAVLFLLGLCFVSLIRALNAEPTDQPLLELFFSTYYFWIILILATPIITMRSFALEKFTGTFETLMTAPVGDLEVVLAKFSAAVVFHMLTWAPLAALVLALRPFGNESSAVDWAVLGSTFLGIFLLGLLYMALGCLASALTRSLIIAAVIALAAGFALWLLSFLAVNYVGEPGWQSAALQHVSLIDHMRDFSRGIIDTRALVFYFSSTALLLFLTWKVVESRRWR